MYLFFSCYTLEYRPSDRFVLFSEGVKLNRFFVQVRCFTFGEPQSYGCQLLLFSASLLQLQLLLLFTQEEVMASFH